MPIDLSPLWETRRAAYLFNTRAAARAVGCHPNKFHSWWRATRRRLQAIYKGQPDEFQAEVLWVLANDPQAKVLPGLIVPSLDRRLAARSLAMHPNRFADWWDRTLRKLNKLRAAAPMQFAVELLALMATARTVTRASRP